MKETLKWSLSGVKECGDKYVTATNDLAVAKVATQIKVQKYPEFDDCFIQFGQIHTILSVFLSIGKILEGSGVPIIFSKQRSLLVVPSTNF